MDEVKFCKDCKHILPLHLLPGDHKYSQCKFGSAPAVRSLVSGGLIEPAYPYCSQERASSEKCGVEGRNYERRE